MSLEEENVKNNVMDFAGSSGENGEQFKAFPMEKLLESLSEYQTELEEQEEIKDKIRTCSRAIDKVVKKINFMLLGVHSDPSENNLQLLAENGKLLIQKEIHPLIHDLNESVPKGEHYKYNFELYRHTFQRLATSACMIHFLKNKTLCTLDECAELINVPSAAKVKNSSKTIRLDYDDYLVGLLDMGNELSRFCRNCITFGGETSTVMSIHKTLNQLNSGMHNITFKNDYVRKKYDGLKYHLKAVEEVVYDLKIRKLEENLKLDTSSDALPELEKLSVQSDNGNKKPEAPQ